MLTIDKEFAELIPPPTAEELAQLEANVVENGCREPLVVWEGHGILLDGHNRKSICERRGITFKTVGIKCADRDDAKIWIIRNQFGRRNLNAAIRCSLVNTLKPLLAKKAEANSQKNLKQGPERQKSDARDCTGRTDETLAKEAGVSRDTIRKMEKVEASPVVELSRMTRAGEVSINAAAKVAAMPEKEAKEVVKGGASAVKEAAKKETEKKKQEVAADKLMKADGNQKKVGKALPLAYQAISILQKIPPKDVDRDEALATVIRWCNHNK